jgi:hypothetical protein
MKKPYQIETQRAVKRLEEMAADENSTMQMVLPMAQTGLDAEARWGTHPPGRPASH